MPGSGGAEEPEPWPRGARSSERPHPDPRLGARRPRGARRAQMGPGLPRWAELPGARRGPCAVPCGTRTAAAGEAVPEVPPAPPQHCGLGWNVVTPVTCSRLVGMLEIFVLFLPSSSSRAALWCGTSCPVLVISLSPFLQDPCLPRPPGPHLSLLPVERTLQGGRRRRFMQRRRCPASLALLSSAGADTSHARVVLPCPRNWVWHRVGSSWRVPWSCR